jgi:Rieske 2Fe-2S family protein
MIRETRSPGNEAATEMQRTLPSSAYLSQETFERECERIFATEWFCAGRGEALLAPGHFLKVDVAGESVLIVRTRSGELRAFYNVCRHRGSRIVMDDPSPSAGGPGASGRFKGSMVCPHHGWTSGLAGELRLAPFLTESDGLRREELSLHPVAVEGWGGFVFVHLTRDETGAEGPTLGSQLGPHRRANGRATRWKSCGRRVGSPTTSPPTGSASWRISTSATTAAPCTLGSARSSRRSSA